MHSMPVFGGHESPTSTMVPRWVGSALWIEGGPSAVCPPAPRLIELIKIKQIVTLA